VLFYGAAGGSSGVGDLQIVPLAGGPPSVLIAGGSLPLGFTTDGNYVLWLALSGPLAPDLFMAGVPATAGATPSIHPASMGGSFEEIVGPGSKVFFSDNLVSGPSGNSVTIVEDDPSPSGSVRTLVTSANPGFAVAQPTSGGPAVLVYATNAGNAGVYRLGL
jgi:hypothetical protein